MAKRFCVWEKELSSGYLKRSKPREGTLPKNSVFEMSGSRVPFVKLAPRSEGRVSSFLRISSSRY